MLVGLCALSLVSVGCGAHTASPPVGASGSTDCPQVQTVSFDKTKFVFHSGLGFGAFHHFIYQPFRSGAFTAGTPGRVRHLAEAALAAGFTVHELRLAKQNAEANPTLCRVVATPLNEAAAALQGLTGSIRSGRVSSGDLDQVNGSIEQARRGSTETGTPITDQVPSLDQLSHPT